MATRKVTITVPEQTLDEVRRLVAEGRASNVSAYIASALEKDVRRDTRADSLADLVAEMVAEAGQPDPAEQARARALVEAVCGKRQVA